MNIIAISGRLTRDPELKTTTSGKEVVEFTVAVDRPGTRDQTDFIDCVAWDKKAEFIAQYFQRGKRIEVSGVLTTRSYEKVRCAATKCSLARARRMARPLMLPLRLKRPRNPMTSARCPMMMTFRSEKGEQRGREQK